MRRRLDAELVRRGLTASRQRALEEIGAGRVLVGGRERSVPIYDRDSLGAGARIRGPIVVVELSSTTYVAPEFTLRVDDFGNLQLEAAR